MVNTIENRAIPPATDRVPDSTDTALFARLGSSTTGAAVLGVRTAEAFTSPDAELAALLGSCGVFDLGWRSFLRCSGRDRVRWLNGMVTNSVKGLQPNQGCYAFVLNAQGRIQGDLNIYLSPGAQGEELVLQTGSAQVEPLMAFLRRYIIMDQVELSRIPEWSALGFAGPAAAGMLRALNLPCPDQAAISISEGEWRGAPVTVVAAFAPLVPRFELWGSPDTVYRVWQAALQSNATPCGAHALEKLRILEGTPAYGVDIGDRDLPQETGQTRALNFTKGCYLGQEIVERIRSRGNVHRAFSGFLIDGGVPAPRTAIMGGDKIVGEITSAARIQRSGVDRTLALGYIRREAVDGGQALSAEGYAVRVMALPFAEDAMADQA